MNMGQLEIKLPQESYWQQGVNDARAGLPLDNPMKHYPGYRAGWNFGAYGNKPSPWYAADMARSTAPGVVTCPTCGK